MAGAVAWSLLFIAGVSVAVIPPSDAAAKIRVGDVRLLAGRLAGAVLLGLVILVVSGWLAPAIVLGVGAFLAIGGWQRRDTGNDTEIARLEALASWIESVRDVLMAGEQPVGAITSTVGACPPIIRPHVRRLAAGLSRQDPDVVFRRFADDLDDPLADLVAAGLAIAIRRGARTVPVLTALAEQTREQVDRRRLIEAERAPTRREVQALTLVMGALVILLLVLGRSQYLDAYDTATGQLFLGLMLALYVGLLIRVQQLAAFPRPGRFLTSSTVGGPWSSPFAWMVVLTGLGVAGLLLALSGWMQPAPSLARTVEHLRRPGAVSAGSAGQAPATPNGLFGPVVRLVASRPRLLPSPAELRLVNRTVEQHVVGLVLAFVGGLVGPPLVLGLLQASGLIGLDVYVPMLVGLVCAVLGPVLVHTVTVGEAAAVRADLRYQVSAYLDVVTMLLAGNTGYEGALEQAAHAGDGRLFLELRRRMRESGARGSSLTDALRRTGAELGLDELEQIAATAALSATEGAPVARTLAAKCATLRGALATEQESEARLRTSRLTTPVVGMALIFMALVMYPALNFS